MNEAKRYFSIVEVSSQIGIDEKTVYRYIEREWISPLDTVSENIRLDAEDLARIRLVHELQVDFGVNEEAIPIILHLVDQLHFIRNKI